MAIFCHQGAPKMRKKCLQNFKIPFQPKCQNCRVNNSCGLVFFLFGPKMAKKKGHFWRSGHPKNEILSLQNSVLAKVLECVSRASSKESKRTSSVPDWSHWCISRQECSMQVSRKLCINFEVSSFQYLNYPLQLKTVLLLTNTWATLASVWSNFDGVKDDLPGVGFFFHA